MPEQPARRSLAERTTPALGGSVDGGPAAAATLVGPPPALTNGSTHGSANGTANGSVNGSVDGPASGSTNGSADAASNGSAADGPRRTATVAVSGAAADGEGEGPQAPASPDDVPEVLTTRPDVSVERLEVVQDDPGAEQAEQAEPEPAPEVEPEPEPKPEPVDPVAATVAAWRAGLTSDGGPDSSLAGAVQSGSWLDLTHAHPSGLAQLLAGRPTRLSSLVREAGAHAAARRRARAIRAASTALAADRGVRGCYLAAGVVRWGTGGSAVSAPVLLRGCTLRPRGSAAEDFDLQLDDGAVVNAELIRAIGSAFGIAIDGAELSALAFGQRGFDPRPVHDWLEARCAGLPGFRLERSLVVATFTAGTGAVLADLDAAAAVIEEHDLLAQVAGLRRAGGAADGTAGEGAVLLAAGTRHGLLPGGRERDEHPRALDLDPAQRAAVEAVLAGGHLAVEGPPGTGVSHTLLTAAVALADEGRHVLALCPRRPTADALLTRARAAGVDDLLLDVRDGGTDRLQVLAGLVGTLDAALVRAAALATPQSDPDVHRITDLPPAPPAPPGLHRARDRLAGASAALHAVREPWGVSAYQAMVAWAELTGRPTPPKTRVRLPEPVLSRLDAATRERVRTHLHLASASGGLTLTAVDTRWFDAEVKTEAEARTVLAAARAARDNVTEAAGRVEAVAAGAGIAAPGSVSGWKPLLELLLDLRETLDVMQPAVFELPLPDLAQLVASVGQGRVKDAGPAERLRRRRRAAALVRPGVHVTDLHRRLVAAQAQRTRWQQLTGGETYPKVPTGLDEAWAAVDRVEAALVTLAAAFGGEPKVRLRAAPVDELARRLDDLAGDEGGILGQPRRLTLLRGLNDAGLGPLVEDLRTRRVPAEEVDGELDLAWWGGVLEAIVNADNRLARHDGAAVRAAAADLAAGEQAQRVDAVTSALDRRAARVAEAVRRHPDQEAFLRGLAAGDSRAMWPVETFRRAGDLLAVLRPVWLMSPDTVARCVEPPAAGGPTADAVLVDDAGCVGMFEAAATLARARQVVVGGDRLGLQPPEAAESVMTAVCQVAPVHRLDRDHRTRDGRLLAPVRHRYGQRWDAVRGAGIRPDLRLDLVGDGMALPVLGEELAISPDAEVRRVVELVAEHAALRADESLVVVTLGERHAERIDEALRTATRTRGILARWLDEQAQPGVAEPFLIRSAGKLQGLERDAAIVTVGLARTPHARVVHRFGVLDGAGGAGHLVAAMTRSRLRTVLVSCFGDEDLQPERLRTDGARLLRDVLAAAAGRGSTEAESRPGPVDALVADLKARLEAAGMPVRLGIGDADWPVDLALTDPQQPHRMMLAVDLDGPRYAARGLRDRDRQRPERLRRAGWAYCRVSAMDAFSDPDAEVERVRQAWIRAILDQEREVAMVEGTSKPAISPGVPAPGPQQPALPDRSSDDTDTGWGETPDESGNDRRLVEERPPHWE